MRYAFAALALATLSASAFAADSYTIDPAHTYPHFTISHLGFSTMHGRFNSTSGTVVVDRKGTGSSVDVKIATASVDTGFQKRDDHLRSGDFLNAVEFPVITYKSTKIVFSGESAATVDGNLTMSGVTKPVTLKVGHIKCAVNPQSKKDVCGFDATAKIKRSDFGIKFALPNIGDDMDLTFEVEAVKG